MQDTAPGCAILRGQLARTASLYTVPTTRYLHRMAPPLRRRLTDEERSEIRASALSERDLERAYKVTVEQIRQVRSWDGRSKLTPAQRAEIAEDQRTCAAIAASYGVSRMAVSMIKRGTWGKNSDGEPVRIRGLADAAVRE